jgi:predicted transcriptional regulator
MSDISQIDGQAVRLQRETLGWATTDLATLACLSTKQIKQIEEGGISAFYSENVKLTAARKVAALLQMTEAQLFGQVAAPVLENPVPFEEELSQSVAETTPVHTPLETIRC